MMRAQARLRYVVPMTLVIIVVILYLNTKSVFKTLLVLLAVPFALIGAFWLLYLLHYDMSIAVWVGVIALGGVSAETGVVMLLYLDGACDESAAAGRLNTRRDLVEAVYRGAVGRVRPKIMTASVILAGLLPIMWGHGTGTDVMKRIAAPMVGGIITSVIVVLLVFPAIYYIWRGWSLEPAEDEAYTLDADGTVASQQ